MKRFISIILACMIVLTLAGCSIEERDGTIYIGNVGYDSSSDTFGKSAMVEIGDGLWYDSTTRIVYWWNGSWTHNYAISPSPYYAPNGLPYRYNPETNTFEEIDIYE